MKKLWSVGIICFLISCVSQQKKQERGLQGSWKVQSITNTNVSAAEAVINFQPRNTLSGNTGCNTMFGSYEVDFTTLKLTFGNLMSTKMACSGIKGDCEKLFLDMIQRVMYFKSTADNQIWLQDKEKKNIALIVKS